LEHQREHHREHLASLGFLSDSNENTLNNLHYERGFAFMVDWLASMQPIDGLLEAISVLEENEKDYDSFDQAQVILNEIGEEEWESDT